MEFNSAMLHAYLVGGTQDVHHDPAAFLAKVDAALEAGITAFQLREKGSSQLDSAARLKLARRLRQMTSHYQVPLFIDDDEQLALAVNADGVHVGQKDQRIEQVIANAQGRLMIGYSCNTPAQIAKANRLSAVDYVGVGPIYPTSSKADADPALGMDNLRRLNQQSTHPVVAIGGIDGTNLSEIAKSGVAGAAVISFIMQSHDISATVKQLRAAFK